jgi:hypothetical protein
MLRISSRRWRAYPLQSRDAGRQPMNSRPPHPDAAPCCAFCRNLLPVVNGQIQPWRAASGLFFCNEFCADDAEEARFQSRSSSGQKGPDRHDPDRRSNQNPRPM